MSGKFPEPLAASSKKWYQDFPKSPSPTKHTRPDVEVLDLKNEAKRHLEAETAAYQLKRSKIKDSEYEWLKTAVNRGTVKDKVAASIVLIQESPKYNLPRLISLVSQVKGMFKLQKQGEQDRPMKKQSLITDVRDLFLEELLHPQHKLLKFEEQNLDSLPSANDFDAPKTPKIPRSRLLAHWYFEDQLKDQYDRFLTSLSSVAADNIEANREKAVAIMTDLLISNPEQEKKILDFLVNKIGDPKSRVASKAVFCLNKLLIEHPNMKIIVLREIEKLLFRPNVAQRAQYYSICLLTQFLLDKTDSDVATTLIDVYFAFFKACLKKGEPDSRMMAAILSGVNRAYRFANLENVKINEHIDAVYKVVHVGSFNVSLNALALLHQVIGNDSKQENRFYTAFYRKLLDPQIGTASKRAVFLNLLYRVMKADKNVRRLYAFVKRILQVIMYYPACMSCATLYSLSQIIKVRRDLRQMVMRGPVVVKQEKEEGENGGETVVEGSKSTEDDDDDDVEEVRRVENTILLSNVTTESSANGNSNDDDDKKDVVVMEEDRSLFYDPFARNPLGCGAAKAPISELTALYRHYHPSVSVFAKNIIEGRGIDYSGDPLEDLSLIRFLDRYAFKNPKKLEEKRVVKENDPLAVRAQYKPRGIKALAVDSQAYLNEREERIPADEVFLYKYLKKKNEGREIKEEDEEMDDNDSVNSEEFNEMMDQLAGDKDFEELDIAGEIEAKAKKGGLKNTGGDEDDEDDGEDMGSDEDELNDDGDDEPIDEEVLDEDDDIDLDELDDEDISDIDFNESDDDETVISKSKKSKNEIPAKKSKRKGIDKVFVSAEEFAEMMEEQGKSKRKLGGSNAFSDADGANSKQVDWEISRHQKLSGKFGGNKRKFSNNKFQGKNKKFKRKN